MIIGNLTCIALNTCYFWETHPCLLRTSVLLSEWLCSVPRRWPGELKTQLAVFSQEFLLLLGSTNYQTLLSPDGKNNLEQRGCIWFHHRIVIRPGFEGGHITSVPSRECSGRNVSWMNISPENYLKSLVGLHFPPLPKPLWLLTRVNNSVESFELVPSVIQI